MCHCTFVIVCEVSVNGVGVQTARLSVSSWHWLTDNEEGSVLSTLTICQALPPRCFTMASLRVQMRQNAASCCLGCSASISACSPRLNTAFCQCPPVIMRTNRLNIAAHFAFIAEQ
ncbi:Uncharacterised protein [Salmonella bongori]|nr:Uncharacterised protein [Salmonella bongori]